LGSSYITTNTPPQRIPFRPANPLPIAAQRAGQNRLQPLQSSATAAEAVDLVPLFREHNNGIAVDS